MKKSTKIVLYGSFISILYIILCIWIEKDGLIDKSDNVDLDKQEEFKAIPIIESVDSRDIEHNSTLYSMPTESNKQTVEVKDKNLTDDSIFNNNEYSKISNREEMSTGENLDNTKEQIKEVKQKINENNSSNSNIDTIDKNNSVTPPPIDKIDIAQKKIAELLERERINFYRSRAKITPKGLKTLQKVITILKDVPDIKIEVKGYTDASGKRSVNRWISEERAKSVKNYLGSHGINPVHIEAKGFGEENLLYKDKPYSPLNRRVEIEIKRR
jgi:outer membrane protein OmpA-like peptidoglycan-associated protein